MNPTPAAPTRETALPGGGEWRRAAGQLATRLGSYPGDRVLVFAPPERDPSEVLARRLPRVKTVRIDDEPAGRVAPADGVQPIRMSLDAPAVQRESVDACLVVLAVPLLDIERHRAFVDHWAPTLHPFGKWMELISVEGPDDERLADAEGCLKYAGFEKVRSMRLALGRRGRALYLVMGRWPGSDEPDGEEE